MKSSLLSVSLLAAFGSASLAATTPPAASAAPPAADAPVLTTGIPHPFLCTDSVGGKVAMVSAKGEIFWEVAYTHPQDCWALPNGNYETSEKHPKTTTRNIFLLWDEPSSWADSSIFQRSHYLFCHQTGVIEMTPGKKIAWEYKAPAKTEVHACQPLPGCRVMVVECGGCRLVEVDRAGQVVKEIKLAPSPASVAMHDQFRGARKTADSHYLLSPRASIRS